MSALRDLKDTQSSLTMPNTQPKTKRYASGNDLFLFYIFYIMTKKTGNTGAEKLRGRTHPMMHGIYLLYKLFEGDSRKSYGEEKTNLNSTNNSPREKLHFSL